MIKGAVNGRLFLSDMKLSQLRLMSANLKVFRCGPWCSISFSRCVRPALTNLGRRKPRGLVATYGERALAVGANIAAGAASTVFDALAAVIFRHLCRECSGDWTLRTQSGAASEL
ncbi:hypothetical protein, partial [Phaeobacter sp. B1627]|uniref:hypothetical protein n=1 Tax=Phaeobacter sp. B1627 TaxID=2583809 RepID=UPI001C400961